MKSSTGQNDRLEMRTLLRPISISCLLGACATAAVLLLVSLVMSLQDLSPSLISPASTMAITLGSLLAGYLCSRMVKKYGMMLGGACGSILFVLAFFAGLLSYDTAPGWACLLKMVIMITGGMVGGILGVNARIDLKKRCKIPR